MKKILEDTGFILGMIGFLGVGGAIENGSGLMESIALIAIGTVLLMISHKYAGADDE